MSAFIIRRLVHTLGLVVAISVVVFLGVYAIGNPVDILISDHVSQAERERMIRELGLDQALWRQYLTFLSNLARGSLGFSFVSGLPAMMVILERLPATLELAVFAILVAVSVGIPLGLIAGLQSKKVYSQTIMVGSILGFSLPSFWVALVLIMVFSIGLGWLPTSGRGPTVAVFGVHLSFLTLDGLRHMVLPTLTFSLIPTAMVIRLARAGAQEAIQQDYVKFARAKGLSDRRIIFVHVLKNILIPIVTVLGVQFGTLIGFAVVTESIFAWPGMGKLLIDSIYLLDRPVMVAFLMFTVVLFALINLTVDILYTLLDPRLRVGGAAS